MRGVVVITATIVVIMIVVLVSIMSLKKHPSKFIWSQSFPPSLFKKSRVVEIPRFLPEKQCKALIEMARSAFKRSTVSGTSLESVSKDRTSFSAHLTEKDSPLIGSLRKRISALLHHPENCIEPFQIVRYTPGQFYKSHYDFFMPGQPGTKEALRGGGQRILTFFIYLNDLDDGETSGYTEFPKLNYKCYPEQGKALIFSNVLENGTEDYNTLHQGTSPTKSTKYGMNVWIRNHKFES